MHTPSRMSKPQPPGIQVRQARPADVPSLADLLVAAPDEGSLYQFPHILEHPVEMHKLHVGWLRQAVQDPTTLIRVAVVLAEGKERVVGYSSWTRREVDTESGEKSRIVELHTVEPTAAADSEPETDTNSSAEPSKALVPNKAHTAAMKRGRALLSSSPNPSKTTSCYELGGLATLPAYQGQGIASSLTRWGMDRAAEEGVPIFVTSQGQVLEFYGKLGFRRIESTEYWFDEEGRDVTQEEVRTGNETWKTSSGGISGAMMVWTPPNV
ncbi:acyl-CoA N-acyltransferase [Mycena metata]|uniref:Acyl-CoA N-acyltransferase n=1 Tax=Mycena metata TaxID=1033252 RepID=A0AAD7I875_9AGAR|nr:acyl-CoA N-acyltransferase [Mycena metata]